MFKYDNFCFFRTVVTGYLMKKCKVIYWRYRSRENPDSMIVCVKRCCNWRLKSVWVGFYLLDTIQYFQQPRQTILQHLLTRQFQYKLCLKYASIKWCKRTPRLKPCRNVKNVNFKTPFSLWIVLRTKRRPWYEMAKIDKYLN